jgi:hypothetical protein
MQFLILFGMFIPIFRQKLGELRAFSELKIFGGKVEDYNPKENPVHAIQIKDCKSKCPNCINPSFFLPSSKPTSVFLQ